MYYRCRAYGVLYRVTTVWPLYRLTLCALQGGAYVIIKLGGVLLEIFPYKTCVQRFLRNYSPDVGVKAIINRNDLMLAFIEQVAEFYNYPAIGLRNLYCYSTFGVDAVEA